MKTKSFFLAFLLGMLTIPFFTDVSLAQKDTRGFSVTEDLGTVSNSGQETAYLDLRGWTKVDSVGVSLMAVNETDIDTINFYLGAYTNDGFYADPTAIYQVVTLNVADGSSDLEALLTSNATKLTGTALRGATGVKAVIEAASAGNDATDPNALYIIWHIYGTK